VRPVAGEAPEAIRGRLEETRRLLAALRERAGALDAVRARRRHPRFGGLVPSAWVRFITVHQHHHLKIVREIRKAARNAARKAVLEAASRRGASAPEER